jgi:hypothetical protein
MARASIRNVLILAWIFSSKTHTRAGFDLTIQNFFHLGGRRRRYHKTKKGSFCHGMHIRPNLITNVST